MYIIIIIITIPYAFTICCIAVTNHVALEPLL